MRQLVLASALIFSLLGAPALAQQLPKEEANLSPMDLNRVKVGEPAPDFTLEDSDGKNVTLSEHRGKKNVVLVFYRGHW
jgi:cytochrome oxidase Cu insertion factor (SCO1/SenC/PrrC family)